MIVLAIVCCFASATFILDDETVLAIVQEGGPVETASAVFHLTGAVLAAFLSFRFVWRRGLLLSMCLLLMGLRELDFHVKFTTMGIYKQNFFTSPEVPLVEKTIVTVFHLLTVILVIFVIHFFRRSLVDGIRNHRSYTVTTLAALLLLPFSKLLDSGITFLTHDMSLELPVRIRLSWAVLEETIEMGLALLFVVALVQWWMALRGEALETQS